MSHRIRRLIPAVVLVTSAVAIPALAADNAGQSDSMKQHVQEGTQGVSPETTYANDHETAAQQSKAEKDAAMKQHMEEGTKGVSPETTQAKDRETAAAQNKRERDAAVEQHMKEGTAGVTPHALPEKSK